MGDPDFLYAAADMSACAAFKQSRLRFANATKLHRKSGGKPFPFFSLAGLDGGESIWKKSYSTHVRECPRTWDSTVQVGKAWWGSRGKAEDEMSS